MDIETRRQKQQNLMVRTLERRVRERAQQLYDERGQEDGHALKDWVQAESEIVGKKAFAQLYRKVKIGETQAAASATAAAEQDSSTCETPA